MRQVAATQQKESILPSGYKPKLNFFETQAGIKSVKDIFERKLAQKLGLTRVTAPRFLKVGTGLQDDLGGSQTPVSFSPTFLKQRVEMVHSLAKWKRLTLDKHRFEPGTGLYTDMDAVRKGEEMDPIHSIYVDQWDWELVISEQQRTIQFLKKVVREIYRAIIETELKVCEAFPRLIPQLCPHIKFVHSEELEDMYPDLTPQEREYEIAKKHKAIFIIGIGHALQSGKPHDVRAADYDDWSTETLPGKRGLNGDILVWDDVRKDVLELSSMGIRVDKTALLRQLDLMGQLDRKGLEFHRGVIQGAIPLTIGGGIGQSRLCMLLLQKAHLGEVQSAVWPKEVEKQFKTRGVALL